MFCKVLSRMLLSSSNSNFPLRPFFPVRLLYVGRYRPAQGYQTRSHDLKTPILPRDAYLEAITLSMESKVTDKVFRFVSLALKLYFQPSPLDNW
jgi:hypothetical protein